MIYCFLLIFFVINRLLKYMDVRNMKFLDYKNFFFFKARKIFSFRGIGNFFIFRDMLKRMVFRMVVLASFCNFGI